MQYHPNVNVRAGTPWTIAGTLYDAQGNLLDVTNAQLAWCLLDPNGNPVPQVATITKTDPTHGAIEINVAATDTALNPGRYTDALQVKEGTNTELFWIGQILVAASLF